jgi:hypothetical protein
MNLSPRKYPCRDNRRRLSSREKRDGFLSSSMNFDSVETLAL